MSKNLKSIPRITILFSSLIFGLPIVWAQKPVMPKPSEKIEESKTVNTPIEIAKTTTSDNQVFGGVEQTDPVHPAITTPVKSFKGYRKSTLETGLNLNDGATIILPNLRYRFFLNKTWALRSQIETTHETEISYYYAAANNSSGTKTDKSFNINFNLGAEYHLAGTNRLSPYFGVLAGIGGGSEGQNWKDYYDGTLVIDTVLIPSGYLFGFNYEAVTPTIRLSMGAVAGFDYYWSENLYSGLELGWSFVYTNQTRGVYQWESKDRKDDGFLNNQMKGSTSGFVAQPTIRLGWRF